MEQIIWSNYFTELEWLSLGRGEGGAEHGRQIWVQLYVLCFCCCCSVTKSCLTLWPHELQHTRLPCPSLSPWVCSDSCPLSESVMPSNHLILCHSLLLLPSIFPCIRVFSNTVFISLIKKDIKQTWQDVRYYHLWVVTTQVSIPFLFSICKFLPKTQNIFMVKTGCFHVTMLYNLKLFLFFFFSCAVPCNTGLEEAQAGIKIARRNINILRYIDDTTLMAESEKLKSLLIKVKEESEKVGLKRNSQKTKIMASGLITSWQIDGETVETVSDFILGGSKITADGGCSHEIKRRLLLGRKVMTNLDNILKIRDIKKIKIKSRDITLSTKVYLVKAMVFPVVRYGCESWTIKKAERQRTDAFELWWGRLLRVLLTARRSNQSILKEICPGCSLEGLTLKLKLQYFGHLMGRADSFEKTLMLGKTEGRRKRCDRGWDSWMASPTQWTWVWVNSRSWWTGMSGVLWFMAFCAESDMTEQLNWINLNWYSLQDISSMTRDWTQTSAVNLRILTTRPGTP